MSPESLMTDYFDPPLKTAEAMRYAQERRGRYIPPLMFGLLALMIVTLTVVLMFAAGETDNTTLYVGNGVILSFFAAWIVLMAVQRAWPNLRHRSAVQDLKNGGAQLHWRYAPEEWQRFAEQEYRRDRAIAGRSLPFWQAVLSGVIMAVIMSGVMLMANEDTVSRGGPSIPLPVLILVPTAAILLPIMLTMLIKFTTYLNDRSAYRTRRRNRDIYINRKGVYGMPAGYMSMMPKKSRFFIDDTAHIPVLVAISTRMVMTRHGSFPMNTAERIPIPQGHENEARLFSGENN